MRSLFIVLGAALFVGGLSSLITGALDETGLKLLGVAVGAVLLVVGLRRKDKRKHR